MAMKRRHAKNKSKPQLTAWSYSRYNSYLDCPRKVFYTAIEKRKEPENKYMKKGSQVHEACEDFLMNEGPFVPEMMAFEEEFIELRDRPDLQAEQAWCFDKDWKPTDWFDNNTAWCRVKLDFIYRKSATKMVVGDFKTGKVRDDHETQLGLYALATFMMYSKVKTVVAEIWYLGAEVIDEKTFTRAKDFERLKAEWEERVEPMLADTDFEPTPSIRICGWCHFGSKGLKLCDAG